MTPFPSIAVRKWWLSVQLHLQSKKSGRPSSRIPSLPNLRMRMVAVALMAQHNGSLCRVAPAVAVVVAVVTVAVILCVLMVVVAVVMYL